MCFEWVSSTIYECVPQNAVWCSKDKTGSDIYIGQYSFEKSVLLARIIPQKREAYVAYNGKEIPALSYNVLVNNNNDYQIWVRVIEGHLPSNGVQCGNDSKNNKLLVGRAFHKGYLLPGYVHPLTKVIHIAYGGKEYKYTDFEILIDDNLINTRIINTNNNIVASTPYSKGLETVCNLNDTSPNFKAMSPNLSAVSHILSPNINAAPSLKVISHNLKLVSSDVTVPFNLNAVSPNSKAVAPNLKAVSPNLMSFSDNESLPLNLTTVSPNFEIISPNLNSNLDDEIAKSNLNTESHNLKPVSPYIKKLGRISPVKALNHMFVKIKKEPKD